jgi:RNA polymerase sigma factor (sigma-70 family)
MALDDRSLVTRIGAGDDHAFTELAERHRAGLVRHAQGKLGAARADEAEDVVQEALIKALRALRAGADPVAPGAWLRVIVARCAYDLHAAAGRRPTVPVDEELLAHAGADPEVTVQARAEMRETVAAIVRLPEAQREALVGYELAGKTYDELGAEHGWSTPATKSLLWRARTTLAAERRKWAAAVTQPFAALGAARDWLGHAAERPLTALGTLAPSGADALGCAAAVALTSAAVVIPPATAPDGRAAERPAAEVVAAAPAGEAPATAGNAAAAPGGPGARAAASRRAAAPRSAAAAPGPAASDSPADVVAACAAGTGPLTGFSLGALRRAERTLPAQVEQYTDCGDRISRALLRSA